MRASERYFKEAAEPDKYIIYHDVHHYATLDYDPVAAVDRLEREVEGKDAIIARQADIISEKESKIIDLIKDAQDAHATAFESKRAYNVIEIINAELRVKARNLLNKLRRYGKYLD